MKKPQVILVAEDSLVRLGLRTALAGNPFADVVEAAGALDAIAKAIALQPDIVLLELDGSRSDELNTIREIARAAVQARIIVLTERDEETFVEQALMFGASAYLLKQTAATDLQRAIRAVQQGREYFSPILVHRLRGPSATIPEPDQDQAFVAPSLSPIESLLVRMINQGNLIRQLAQELSGNLKFIREHHPQLLARLKPYRSAWFARLNLACWNPTRGSVGTTG